MGIEGGVIRGKVSFAIITRGVSREGVVRELLTGVNSTTDYFILSINLTNDSLF